MQNDDPFLIETPADAVVLIRLNRPARLNAFTRESVALFNDRLDAIALDPAIRAVIITGAGRAFCAGMDVGAADQRNREAPSGVVERMFWQDQFTGMGRRLRAMPQIVVAAVKGPCAGAGLALALASDVRIAGSTARFLIASVRLGLTAGESGITYFLPRLIGASRAFEIMLTGRAIDADEAERIGLCARCVADEDVEQTALAFIGEVLANSPFAIVHTKRLMWDNLDASYAAAAELENRTQMLASLTDDYKEATAAFTGKRPARFTGR